MFKKPSAKAILLSASVACTAFFSLSTPMAALAQDPAKKKLVKSEADLPRFSYPIPGELQQLLDMPAVSFIKFAQPIRTDVDSTLRTYQIEDHAAHRDLLKARMNLQLLSGDNAAALETIHEIRELQDKPGAKLTSGLNEEAILRARLAGGDAAKGTCPAGYRTAYQGLVQALPWAVAGESIKQVKSFAGLMSKPFFAGIAESELGPTIAKEHALTLAGAETLIEMRVEIEFAVACKQQTEDVATAYVKFHDIAKSNIWTAREAILPAADKLTPINVGIWDSGFDTALFPGKLFTDPAADASDRHGIAFDVMCHRTHGELIPLTPQEAEDYPQLVSDMQAIGDIEGGLDTPGTTAFKRKIAAMSPQQMRSFYDEMGVIDGYAHGTHVAGIAARGNPAVRLAYVRTTYDNGNPHMPPTEQLLKDEVSSYAESVQ